MPWKKTCPMNERKCLIDDYLTGRYTRAELYRRYGIAPKTGRKWLRRFAEEGYPGLADRSRAAHHHPNETPHEIVAALLDFKHRHPKWGAYATVKHLKRLHPDKPWPAVSTVGVIFDRHGLVQRRARRRRTPPHTEPLRHATTAHSVWSADYKGDFAMGNGRRCYPLTISDNYSRYLITCKGMYAPRLEAAKRCYQRAFERYGLPEAMRTDNGYPFGATGIGGLTALSIWLLRLDVMPERIDPGRPQQNPRHERLHRTLKHFAIDPPKANLSAQQRAFNSFRREYNDERPHQSLDGDTPAQWFAPSPRPFPATLPEVQYDESMQVRRVRRDGYIKWGGRQYYFSSALAGQWIGLRQLDTGSWQIYFTRLALGVLDERIRRIVRPQQKGDHAPG